MKTLRPTVVALCLSALAVNACSIEPVDERLIEEELGQTEQQVTYGGIATGGVVAKPEIWSNDGEVVYNNNLGNIGIGTTNPQALLHVQGRTSGENATMRLAPAGANGSSDFFFGEDPAGQYGMQWTYDGSANQMKLFGVKGGEVRGPWLTINRDNGYVRFGKMQATEIKVSTETFPDYVFDKEYKRMGLDDLEAYIQSNKHLPGIPSADTVIREGLSIGESQVKLLEKIEELTLHVIDINKALRRSNQEQSLRIARLEEQLRQKTK